MVVLSVILFLITLASCLDSLRGGGTIRWLRNTPPGAGPYPSVAIVVAARNEERSIEQALQSVLSLDYPDKKILVVDDRSTDRTGEILARMAKERSDLEVLTLKDVPGGWLGKNNAIHKGYLATRSELLLFTDADVVFEKDTLKRGVSFLQSQKLDHLPVLPEIRVSGLWLNVCVGIFGVYFGMFYRPWKVTDPKSKRFVGVGGFNLVRRSALDAIGGFSRISLRPDDDLQLGKTLREQGFRQELLWGLGTCFVEWYPTVGAMIRGLEKNMFAGFRYRLTEALAGSIGIFLLNIYPGIGTFVADGLEQKMWAGMWVLMIVAYFFSSARTGQSRWGGVLFPAGAAIHLYMVWNAVGKTLLHGGIRWRDTFYPLSELKSQR